MYKFVPFINLKNNLKKPRYLTGTLYYLLKNPEAWVITKLF